MSLVYELHIDRSYRPISADVILYKCPHGMSGLCGRKSAFKMAACTRSVNTKKVRGTDSEYLSTLSPPDRKRFQEKLLLQHGKEEIIVFNPYEVWNNDGFWSDSPTTWPDINFGVSMCILSKVLVHSQQQSLKHIKA